jgi:predicted O-methyltransferase YrrM
VTRFVEDGIGAGDAYSPSLFEGEVLTDRHRRIAELVESVPGKLRHADELKLYEMAYLARGPILEIGTDQGRSAAIMSIAVADAGRGLPIYSVDVKASSLVKARANLERLGLVEFVTLVLGDSASIVAASETTFDLVFVDGDHTDEGVRRDLVALRGRVARGASIVLHDYTDPRNEDPGQPLYGVAQAAEACREDSRLRFRGAFGAIGIFEQL